MSSEIYLTKEGRNKMIEELDRLEKRKPLVQEELARAREHGDLKENAEYHAAKETLTKLGQRIAEIESKLSRSKLISEQNIEKDKIFIGVTVTIKDLSDGEEYTYTIVDVEEANFAESKISVQSPMSQGLLGHKVGDVVNVQLPAGLTEFKILKIS
jgi:transcription elongation factor GreA